MTEWPPPSSSRLRCIAAAFILIPEATNLIGWTNIEPDRHMPLAALVFCTSIIVAHIERNE